MATRRPLSKPLIFPKIRNFAELFDVAVPWSSLTEPERAKLAVPWEVRGRGMGEGKAKIGPYLIIREPHGSMAVRPLPFVVDWIKSNMLLVNYDTLHFEIVIWSKKEALVIVSYGQIIGSYWLAVIDPKTIRTIPLRAAPVRHAGSVSRPKRSSRPTAKRRSSRR